MLGPGLLAVVGIIYTIPALALLAMMVPALDLGRVAAIIKIGAGGYEQFILTGIRRANPGLILEGTDPAAVLTLLVLALMEELERAVLPRSMQS